MTNSFDTEIWFTTNARTGNRRAWKYSNGAGRAVPVRLADAELAIATGTAVEISKPPYVGR